ncbi:hypothetical protein E2C01_050772 [Portunus trituberculatus]|uniref:Secreted protein n=1 Tax=Portunus trituberculatus TaxID=210409 RepID=A0A5B7GGV7_PORTR|nr:hypothetical protein [Portunus trituberculatus]MPC56806.1 hypothetical protein [Portunus trituberculatus]
MTKKQTVLHLLILQAAANSSTAGPSSISSFFKPVKRADPATVGPSTYASDSADDDVLSSSAHSAEDE